MSKYLDEIRNSGRERLNRTILFSNRFDEIEERTGLFITYDPVSQEYFLVDKRTHEKKYHSSLLNEPPWLKFEPCESEDESCKN